MESIFLFMEKVCSLLLSSAHLLEEGNERHETIIVSWFTKLLHERLGLFLGKLLAKIDEELEQLIFKDGVVVIFVIKLKDFNEVVESTLVLGILASFVHGVDLSLREHFLSLLGLTSDLIDGLEGRVQVAGTDEVTSKEGVNLAISLEVIDIKGKFNCVNFLLLEPEFSHFALIFAFSSWNWEAKIGLPM